MQKGVEFLSGEGPGGEGFIACRPGAAKWTYDGMT